MEANSAIIRKILEEIDILGDLDSIVDDLKLVDQGVDSLDMASLYLKLEEKFHIKIPDSDLHMVQSINDIVIYLESKIK